MLHSVLHSATTPVIYSQKEEITTLPHNQPLSTSRTHTIVAFINVNIGLAWQPFWKVFAPKWLAFLVSCGVWIRSQLTNDNGNAQLRLSLFARGSKPTGKGVEYTLHLSIFKLCHKEAKKTSTEKQSRRGLVCTCQHGSLLELVIT